MTREQKIEYIAKHYGFENQCRQAVEEMAELTKELCKYQRAENDAERNKALYNISCELADVEIMVQQLKYLVHNSVIDKEIDEKLDRQLNRIEKKSTY